MAPMLDLLEHLERVVEQGTKPSAPIMAESSEGRAISPTSTTTCRMACALMASSVSQTHQSASGLAVVGLPQETQGGPIAPFTPYP